MKAKPTLTVAQLKELLQTVPENARVSFANNAHGGPMWVADMAEVVTVRGQSFLFLQGSDFA